MHFFCSNAFIVIGAGNIIRHFIHISREWVHVLWIHFSSGVMCVQKRVCPKPFAGVEEHYRLFEGRKKLLKSDEK